jgi:hypothetical protein
MRYSLILQPSRPEVPFWEDLLPKQFSIPLSVVREICGSLNAHRRGKLQVAERLSCQISYSGVFVRCDSLSRYAASGPQRRGQ